MGETERSRAEVGVWLLAGLAFVVGTVELVVAGVLDELAASFAVSQGRAGLLMSLYALVYALLGPLLVYLSAGIERRRLLAGALLAFIGANLASAAAPSFALLLASRLLVAASASVIVVVAITLAVAIVAPERRGRAIGLVFAGIVASLVLGVPLGTLIGEFWGWRSLFLLLAGVALLGLPLLLRLLPAIPGAPGIAPAEQLRALARGRVPFAHLASLLQMTGQFTVYTYIVPFLVGSMALDKPTISLVLLVYGGGGILGALLGGRAADRWPGPATFVAFLLLHALALVLLPFATGGLPLLLGAVVFWCVFNMAPGPAIQKYLVELSPDTAAIQISLNTSAIQLGVALGAFIGAILVDQVAVRALLVGRRADPRRRRLRLAVRAAAGGHGGLPGAPRLIPTARHGNSPGRRSSTSRLTTAIRGVACQQRTLTMDSQGSIKNTLIAQLFQQNYDWLCKKLSYQTGCSHSAEDLAAEAFLQVWMLPDPASIRSPRAFLATIAQRLMYESWRRKDLERAYLQILAEAPEAVQPSPHEQWMLIREPASHRPPARRPVRAGQGSVPDEPAGRPDLRADRRTPRIVPGAHPPVDEGCLALLLPGIQE